MGTVKSIAAARKAGPSATSRSTLVSVTTSGSVNTDLRRSSKAFVDEMPHVGISGEHTRIRGRLSNHRVPAGGRSRGRHVQCRIELLGRKLRTLAFSESFLVDPKSSDPIRAYRLFHASESRC
jgi:hypothetical protein